MDSHLSKTRPTSGRGTSHPPLHQPYGSPATMTDFARHIRRGIETFFGVNPLMKTRFDSTPQLIPNPDASVPFIKEYVHRPFHHQLIPAYRVVGEFGKSLTTSNVRS